ncbi:CBS domain-containing protein [Erythrobacter sp. 3-20A1M]|uniref:CBS domain-containing protein n=1 Tax=Erythrobacter sp. 3-20A1M TaxID=2653850 RepID=UPI001BFC674C|nr:CBS domain-containing protein [Erythrobacter sp. 3-20A1M]QWC56786.1 CBS domain-containing protein [Erythrobacter sp. 3-20A1M]
MDIAAIIAERDPSDILTCDGAMAVRDAVGLLAGKRIGALPIVQDGEVTGIFSERDVVYRLANEGALCLDRKVSDVMTSPAITVAPSTRVDEALALMTKRRIRHLPVLDNGKMVGFVSIGDLVKSRFDRVQEEAEQLRVYIQSA